jgi:hypothetical protein
MGQDTRFTPGPWEWDAGLVPPDGPDRYADIFVDGGETIIAMFNDRIPEGRANAHLISASPDMYEVLEAAIEQVREELNYLIEQGTPKEWRGDVYRLSLIVNSGDAALAKARGEQ